MYTYALDEGRWGKVVMEERLETKIMADEAIYLEKDAVQARKKTELHRERDGGRPSEASDGQMWYL